MIIIKQQHLVVVGLVLVLMSAMVESTWPRGRVRRSSSARQSLAEAEAMQEKSLGIAQTLKYSCESNESLDSVTIMTVYASFMQMLENKQALYDLVYESYNSFLADLADGKYTNEAHTLRLCNMVKLVQEAYEEARKRAQSSQ